ncbi:MAG: acetate--CoA ligase family protein, partial [Deltaproteobacteria bacterium]|nr:acetate--CoA ligase family protein [Deltaproteobacteria bacterium]
VLASQPLPAGNRLAILTNAGGPGILAADRAEAEGLALPTLSKRLQRVLAAKLPATAVTGNPVDMIASATPEQYRLCLTRLLQSDEVDMVTVMFIPPLMVRVQEVAEAILNARKDSGVAKPVVAVLMAERREEPALMRLEQGGIPVFRFPEDAMVALTHLWRYQVWRSQEEGPRVRFDDVNSAAAREVIAAALRTPAAPGDSEKGRRGLSPSQAQSLLAAYGMLPPRPTAEPVRPDSPPVLELVLEVQSDPNFGPVFRVGLGGAFPDAYFSQSRLHPVTRQDAEGMLARFRPGRVPHGQELIIRDLSAVTDLLLRLSQLVEDHPEVAAVDLRLHWMDAMDQGFKWAEPRVCIAPLSPWDAFIFRHLDD